MYDPTRPPGPLGSSASDHFSGRLRRSGVVPGQSATPASNVAVGSVAPSQPWNGSPLWGQRPSFGGAGGGGGLGPSQGGQVGGWGSGVGGGGGGGNAQPVFNRRNLPFTYGEQPQEILGGPGSPPRPNWGDGGFGGGGPMPMPPGQILGGPFGPPRPMDNTPFDTRPTGGFNPREPIDGGPFGPPRPVDSTSGYDTVPGSAGGGSEWGDPGEDIRKRLRMRSEF